MTHPIPDDALSEAQMRILVLMVVSGSDLSNGDECPPTWWIEGGFGVHPRAAAALARTPLVQFYRRSGGHPGILHFRITEAGARLLGEHPMAARLMADMAASHSKERV